MAEFQKLGVQPWLAKQCTYMALHHPTPIQQRCIPAVLAGKHVVGGAATGSGKTAAFALPILQNLATNTYGVYALVLTPSRELAYQIIDQFIAFGAPLQVRTMLAIGGVFTETQIDALKARPHIVAATPGRLCHLLRVFGPETKKAFAHLRYLVLDEADRLTDGDMQSDVRALLQLLPKPTPQRQVLMFTATVQPRLTTFEAPAAASALTAKTVANTEEDNAAEAHAEQQPTPFAVLAELGITDRKTLEVIIVAGAMNENGGSAVHLSENGEEPANTVSGSSGTSDGLTGAIATSATFHLPEALAQKYLFIPNVVKLPYLVAALRAQGKNQSTIVYVNSCLRAELVRLTLQLLGFPVCSLDSLLTQQHRLDNVARFKLGIARILVCTDIAARGLDIPLVGLVLHYDVPKHADTYVHRVGRTARAGRAGTSVAFVTEYDVYLVQRIEKRTKSSMELWKSPAAEESAILPLLDEVSTAKIQAKQQVTEQFESRVQTNKAHAAEKRDQRAQAKATVMAQAQHRRERRLQETYEQERQAASARRAAPPEKGLKRRRAVTSDTAAEEGAREKVAKVETSATSASRKEASSAKRSRVVQGNATKAVGTPPRKKAKKVA